MSDVIKAATSLPGAPVAGVREYFDATALLPAFVTTGGRYGLMCGSTFNAAIAAQGPGFAADTYITDSHLLIPSFGLQARTVFHWQLSASKTAAGVATPIYVVRIGTGKATTDTAILTLTGPAQTGVIDIGTLNLLVTVRSIGSGSAAVLQGTAWWDHRGTIASSTIGTGFANDGTGHVEATSSGFDSTAMAGKYVGLSINGGASAAWTLTQCFAEGNW